MTLFAIHGIFHAEGHAETVAGAARLPLFHIFHGMGAPPGAGNDDLAVTVCAAISFGRMGFMAEKDAPHIAGELILHPFGNRMAFCAIACDVEGTLAVMTGTTGIPLFHFGHGPGPVVGVRLEQGVMAIRATIGVEVECMAETRA